MLRTCLFVVPWLFFAAPAFANDDDLRAVDVLPRELLARADGSSRLRNINIGLTAGIAGTLRISKGGLDDRNSKTSMDLWIGLRYPRMERPTAFVSVGTEVGFRDFVRPKTESLEWEEEVDRTDSYTEVVPEVRFGYAVVEPSLGFAMLVFQTYAFTGYRVANRYNPAAVRIGFGVSSSFPIMLSTAMRIPLPIPTTAEVIFDIPSKGAAVPALRLGWVF